MRKQTNDNTYMLSDTLTYDFSEDQKNEEDIRQEECDRALVQQA